MLAHALLGPSLHVPTILVFTSESCPGCSKVGVWRQEWEARLAHLNHIPIRFATVGDGDIKLDFMTLVRKGIRAFPTLAVLEQDFRVHTVVVGFRAHEWDQHVSELLASLTYSGGA